MELVGPHIITRIPATFGRKMTSDILAKNLVNLPLIFQAKELLLVLGYFLALILGHLLSPTHFPKSLPFGLLLNPTAKAFITR
jgi:hypothetical protein